MSEPTLQAAGRPDDLVSNAGSRRSTQSKGSRVSRASGSNASRRVLEDLGRNHQRPQQGEEKACVVICHGNACCRLDAFHQVHCFLPLNIAVCCFDFSGSGMSGGEYVSLGFFERDDLASVIQNLREKRAYTRVGVWGRSMGATTAVLHSARDPSLAGVVADSPFSDLWNLMKEIVNSKLRVPDIMCRPVFEGIRLAIQQQAGFDICEVSPLKHLDSCFLPIFFLHGEADAFVQPHHSELLRKGWQGEATRVTMPDTEHNDHREERFIARAALFMVRALRWESYLDNLALEALTKGLLPTTTNLSRVQSNLNGSATLMAAEHFEKLALSSEIRKMAMSRDVSERQLGLVLAAAELSGAYKGAEKVSLGPAGSTRMKLPGAFQGTICYLVRFVGRVELPSGSWLYCSGKKEASESSYEPEEGEEEEAKAEDLAEGAEAAKGPAEKGKEEPVREVREQPPKEEERSEESHRGDRHRREVSILPAAAGSGTDPHYLSRALQKQQHLRPTGKAAAREAKKRGHSEATPRVHSGGEEDERSRRSRRAGPEDEGGRRRHHEEGHRHREPHRERREEAAASPDRPPIVRRPRDPKEERKNAQKKRKKNNKGQKRRERGQDYRARRDSHKRSGKEW
eukprot:s239_g9.t1